MIFKEHEVEWSSEKIERYWNFYANQPNNQYFAKVFGRSILKIANKYVNKGINKKIILDFGCGTGGLLTEINEKFKPEKYFALDSSEFSLKTCQNINVNFPVVTVLSGKSKMAIKDNSIDVCFLIEAIEHLDDATLDQTLAEIYRVLKKDGVLIITTPNCEDLSKSKFLCPDCGCKYHRYQHVRSWNNDTLLDKLNKCFFKEISIFETNLKNNSILINAVLFLKRLYKRDKRLLNLVAILNK